MQKPDSLTPAAELPSPNQRDASNAAGLGSSERARGSTAALRRSRSAMVSSGAWKAATLRPALPGPATVLLTLGWVTSGNAPQGICKAAWAPPSKRARGLVAAPTGSRPVMVLGGAGRTATLGSALLAQVSELPTLASANASWTISGGD